MEYRCILIAFIGGRPYVNVFSLTLPSHRIFIPNFPVSAWDDTLCFHVSSSTQPPSILILPLTQKSLTSHLVLIGQSPIILSLFVQPYFERCQRGSSTSKAIIPLSYIRIPSTPENQAFRTYLKRSSNLPSYLPWTTPVARVDLAMCMSTGIGTLSLWREPDTNELPQMLT